MPYRPGYGLGSWIPPEVILGMKKEAYSRSAILLSEQMDAAAQSLARELRMAQAPTKNPLNSQQDIGGLNDNAWFSGLRDAIQQHNVGDLRRDAWSAKLTAYGSLFDNLKEQSNKLMQAAKTGDAPLDVFSTFASAVEAPVDWLTSTIDYMDRGYDSISTSSTYLSNVDVEEYTASMNAETHSNATSSAKKKLGALLNGGASSSVSSDVETALQKAYTVHAVESTLILSSFATHRLVKQFKKLVTDPDKLREAWNYFNDDPIPHPVYATPEFAEAFLKASAGGADTLKKRISMVSEIFQGSVVVGFVHFLKVDRTNTQSSSASTRLSAKAAFDFAKFLDSISGSTSATASVSKKMSSMSSHSVVDVVFDIVSLGYIPKLTPNSQAQTVNSIVKFMDPSQKGADEQGSKGQNQQQSNSKALIDGLLEGVNKVTQENPVMDIKTFMDAFADYANAAHENPKGVGAPVGLNVKEWTKIDVMAALADHYFGEGHTDEEQGGDAAASTDGGATPAGGAAPA
eukprot:CAMPEP_0174834698 /NCGR_PEP_ID=MMETSP1114-20130205/4986_1 /TAXON_ID=312471 /ORGANISM="Neobodo designis, Strain CCAP 1951/1" /LENGTH=515 /DNA_ID=CAMNT_0016068621 /DNA_START=1 /DNA_END=1548 /DNA_ORIENTATION=-